MAGSSRRRPEVITPKLSQLIPDLLEFRTDAVNRGLTRSEKVFRSSRLTELFLHQCSYARRMSPTHTRTRCPIGTNILPMRNRFTGDANRWSEVHLAQPKRRPRHSDSSLRAVH
jgi:hypothetical protein